MEESPIGNKTKSRGDGRLRQSRGKKRTRVAWDTHRMECRQFGKSEGEQQHNEQSRRWVEEERVAVSQLAGQGKTNGGSFLAMREDPLREDSMHRSVGSLGQFRQRHLPMIMYLYIW